MKNKFCDHAVLTNEASVEAWFISPLLEHLSFSSQDVKLKTSIKEFRIGRGSKSVNYKPDYIVSIDGMPTLVIDAKSPEEKIENWTWQCSAYCLELNKLYDHNPVKYYLLSNGLSTALYSWDKEKPLVVLEFSDFVPGNSKLLDLESRISKPRLSDLVGEEQNRILEAEHFFDQISMEDLSKLFQEIHRFIWTEEKKTPSAAFTELLKIIFIKVQKDKELHEKFGHKPRVRVGDVVFSKSWIQRQTEQDSPINDPLFKNLLRTLEKDISHKTKKRFFDRSTEINLSARTIEKIVERLEHIDLYSMDEDVHGRMFESFLDATVRGKELGQYFTPRDIVKLMVELANPRPTKTHVDSVLDACCGSGGFLIMAMTHMLKAVDQIPGISNIEKKRLQEAIKTESVFGIDAGSDPAIYRIARMNMYLHGDGGSRIYFADSLDKNVGEVGRASMEYDDEIRELRSVLIDGQKKFDVILSNPPFSLTYSRDNRDQRDILNQYDLSVDTSTGKELGSILSSVMFLERYRDLVAKDGKIFAVIDDSILSGDAFAYVRDYIRRHFVIVGLVSLPGDAFRRSAARVKTSIIILRLKQEGESQPDVFMEKSIYFGLDQKTAKRIGIDSKELEEGKAAEFTRIVEAYRQFERGVYGPYVVPAARIQGRLDVKYCVADNGRKVPEWLSKGLNPVRINEVLKPAVGRETPVADEEVYPLLRVQYDGDVLEGDAKIGGIDCSYSTLYRTDTWDILYSNMGVGRGAIGIVPPYLRGRFVSNEYTILRAGTEEEALYYVTLLRTKEVLGDILSSTTGMNRGRIKWATMGDVLVPRYRPELYDMADSVKALNDFWHSFDAFQQTKSLQASRVAMELELEGADARTRWLAAKPPE